MVSRVFWHHKTMLEIFYLTVTVNKLQFGKNRVDFLEV